MPWAAPASRATPETQPEAYPTRLEAGTLNSHGIAGLGASLAFLKRTGWDAVRMHESVLARRFYETVRTIPGVKVYGNFAVQLRAPIVSLNIADLDSSEVADELAERFEIATRPGAHCAPRLHRALGTEDQGAVRFSWSYFNTEAETDAAAEAVCILAAGGSLTMRKKEERFVVTFATTTGAMAMERACRTAGLPGRLIPVPRSITAGAWDVLVCAAVGPGGSGGPGDPGKTGRGRPVRRPAVRRREHVGKLRGVCILRLRRGTGGLRLRSGPGRGRNGAVSPWRHTGLSLLPARRRLPHGQTGSEHDEP